MLRTVKHLAVDSRVLAVWDVTTESKTLRNFQNLQQLTVVVHIWNWQNACNCMEGWTEDKKCHDLYSFVGKPNYALGRCCRRQIRSVLVVKGDVTKDSESLVACKVNLDDVMIKLCMRGGKVCCEWESFVGCL